MSDTQRRSTFDDQARTTLDDERIRTDLDHEHQLVSEAILLVSSGGSPRVTVAGLHFPEQILEASQPLARSRGVRLVALWTDDERGADIAVEALDEGER